MIRLRHTPSFAARLGAGLCAALVLLLAVLAACPAAHAWIHGHENHAAHSANSSGTHGQNPADPDDDGCIVTLFAHGVVSTTIFAALAVAFFLLISPVAQPCEALYLPAPRYRLPPLCGPPQS
jgi:hypothetical protein